MRAQRGLITENTQMNISSSAASSPMREEEPCVTSLVQPSVTSVTSLVDRADSVRVTDAVSILSDAVEGLRDMCGESQGQGEGGYTDGGRSPGSLNMQQVEALVASLNETADRLQGCFQSAQSLRLSLRSLGEEEKMTKVALRDYKDKPARTLLSSVRTISSP